MSRKEGPTTPCAQPLPGITRAQFGLVRVRSPLLTESLLFSLPAGTEMFHFPAFPPHRLCVQRRVTASSAAGFPHSDTLGSQSGYRLPQAYRRFPRPSSAPDAKASTVRPWKLQHNKDQGHTKKLLSYNSKNEIARCSRPLYSSQTTTPTTPTRAAGRQHGQEKAGTARTPHPDNTGQQGHAGTVCCPRTQQRAKDPTPTGPQPRLSNPPQGAYSHRTAPHRGTGRRIVDVPPTSTRRTTNAHETGLPSPQAPGTHAGPGTTSGGCNAP